MSYTPTFTPPYEDGWKDKPYETTPIQASALNAYDEAIVNIETYLGEGGGGGTTVVANPTGEPTDDLDTIQIDETIYNIAGGGGNANIWTGTQAEYEAQASQIADDTVVLITDDEEHTQAFDIYSTDEQVVGTWTDGSTVYERTYNYTTAISVSANGAWTDTGTNISFVSKMIDATVRNNTFVWGVISAFKDSNNLKLTTGGNLGSNTLTVDSVTIRYTKS